MAKSAAIPPVPVNPASSPSIGDNLKAADVGGVAGAHLKSLIERIERLNEEKAALQDDIKSIFEEAKGNGFDTKIIRAVIRERAKDADDRAEFSALFDTYWVAIGMV